MSSVNKAIVVGNVGADPEVRYTSSGAAICSLSVATSYKPKDRDEETEWHRCTLFDRTAEIAGEYIRKGSKVYIEGRLRTRKWEDKDGITRYTTEILCERLVMLGDRAEKSERSERTRPERSARDERPRERPTKPAPRDKGESGFDDMDDDAPF